VHQGTATTELDWTEAGERLMEEIVSRPNMTERYLQTEWAAHQRRIA
jgi:hypothetical protein